MLPCEEANEEHYNDKVAMPKSKYLIQCFLVPILPDLFCDNEREERIHLRNI